MSSTDKAEDAATEGYTVGDDVPVASSGSPDHTTTSTTTSNDHNPAHSIASVQAETVQTKDDPPATPATPTSPAAGDDSVTPPAPAANEASAVEGAAPEDDGPVGYLKSMFPEMDTETLEAVLAAHGGSVENAIEALLAMSDPSAAPPQANSAQTTSLSQLQLDEALAKQLYAEDHAAAQHRHQQQQQQQPRPTGPAQPPGPPPPVSYQTYVPRARRGANDAQPAGADQPAGPQATHAGIEPGERDSWHNAAGGFQERHKDELDELTETVTKLADQGKKALTGFWGKAKEQAFKLNEQINASASPTTAQAGTASGSAPAPPSKPEQTQPRTSQPQRQSSLPSRYTKSATAPSSTAPSVPDKASVPASSTDPAPDASSPAPPPVAKDSTAAPPAPEAGGSAGEPAQAQARADFSKIGLLPRQSISLLDRKKAAGEEESEDEDDLEYVKSPFDDD